MKNTWKPENLYIKYASPINGIYIVSCFAENATNPLGTAWVTLTSSSLGHVICYIEDIYVRKNDRRFGVATFILKNLLESYGVLQTGTGSKEGGKLLLKSMGWKQNKQTGDWYLFGKKKKI